MQENFKYFAFISFQSADAKEALWVQKAIEGYRLPTAVSRSHSLPKKMPPCFCYLNDINLSEELMQELKLRMEQSQYLIVVCSPRSAKSTFVNGGIDYFVNLGRRDRIIPLIVDGIPYTNDPETECYPEALKRHFPKSSDPMQDHQILGVNLNEEGAGSKRWKRQRAVLMVIARMLNLEFENLWNREVERRKHQRRAIIAGVAGILCLLGLTWYFSRSVDIEVSISEMTARNENLPLCLDGKLTIQLANEEKTLDSINLDSMSVFKNIPQRFIGRETAVTFSGEGYLNVDTVLTLQQSLTLPVCRDAELYGHIVFRLRGVKHPELQTLTIAGRDVHPDEDGLIDLQIPVEEQLTAYPVLINGMPAADSIHMPCGENDILLANSPLQK